MAASDDEEAETWPELVAQYYFLNEEEIPVSFSELPCLWSGTEKPSHGLAVYLHGKADKGLRTLCERVKAWKLDLSAVNPEILVMCVKNKWVKIHNPRKSYEKMIQSLLITVQCLHYLRRNPDVSRKTLWGHLDKVFRSYDESPGPKDLAVHISLIREAVKREDNLAKSKFITKFLEKPTMRKLPVKGVQAGVKRDFIVDDNVDPEVDGEDDVDEEEPDNFDNVCAICDDGGDLLICDGRCFRSFHATPEAGKGSKCVSLGFSQAKVEAMGIFYCKNCALKQHQCFICKKLGSSDESSSGAEVFACVSATCGRFYHPSCVATSIHSKDEAAAIKLQKSIAEGKHFTCPIHKCYICNHVENKEVPELQFAVCRRCPISYHRKCLPMGIHSEDSEDEEGTIRAWKGLLHKRILIYCLKHAIDEELGTPIRKHVKFPVSEDRKTLANTTTQILAASSSRQLLKRKALAQRNFSEMKFKKRSALDSPSIRELLENPQAKKSSGNTMKRTGNKRTGAGEYEKNRSKERRLVKNPESERHLPLVSDSTRPKVVPNYLSSDLPLLDDTAKRRVLDIIRDAESSVRMQDILKKHKQSSNSLYVDKTITMGKLKSTIEAARTALKKIEEGHNIEDAQAVCDPAVLRQLLTWKGKLKTYLAPFIHGERYTSYGRHFTNEEKLQEIVDRLHWYVQNGNTVVDFCCGSNQFSSLMAKKMEETGKKCFYKNYDMFPTKNDFNFERRDWMTVSTDELPSGENLIMGLNPPFGPTANTLINKALQFKPKLLILIVPEETQRLDKKISPYDLVWEDDYVVSGKSFYLPGCLDENDKPLEQGNVTPPLLYLWSRPDWTLFHKNIAMKQGHIGIGPQQHRFVGHLVAPEQGDRMEGMEEEQEAWAPSNGGNASLRSGNVKPIGLEMSRLATEAAVIDRDMFYDQTGSGRDQPNSFAHGPFCDASGQTNSSGWLSE